MDGSVSRPARISAGGGTISSVKIIGCLLATREVSLSRPLPGPFFMYHKGRYVSLSDYGCAIASIDSYQRKGPRTR